MVRAVATALCGALSLAATVVAHGHVSGFIVNGVYYRGYESDSDPYDPNPPITAGWTTDDKDNGFVQPVAFNTSDIICHRSATPAKAHITVAAGSTINVQWNTWPDSHVGPITDMLANCNGPCESVDKTTLKFFKIAQSAYLSGADPGLWVPNTMIANNFSWNIVIPSTLAAGNYVLRHEIIALHASQSANGAQAYPQCISMQVTGGGSLVGSGVNPVGMYSEYDPGIIYNIYTNPEAPYTIPGAPLSSIFPSTVAQSASKATSTGTAVSTYQSGGAAPPPPPPASSTAAAPPPPPPASSSSAAPPPPPPASTTTVRTTLKTTTTTTTTTTTSSAPASGTGAALYQQCGGIGFNGPTSCVSGAKCSVINSYYSQCVPA